MIFVVLWCLRSDEMVQSLQLLHQPTSKLVVTVQKLHARLLIRQKDPWTVSSRVVSRNMLRGSSNDENDTAVPSVSSMEYDAEIEDLKSAVTKYLQLRKEIGADDIAKEYVI
jgi:hypothetical protein